MFGHSTRTYIRLPQVSCPSTCWAILCAGCSNLPCSMAVLLSSLLLMAAVAVAEAETTESFTACSSVTDSLDATAWPAVPLQNPMENFTMCVYMDGSDLVLPYTLTPVSFNVMVFGNYSTVTCDPSARLTIRNYSAFPLIFQQSSFVVIERLNFRGCLRPLRFSEVLSVQLVEVSFRFVLNCPLPLTNPASRATNTYT